MTMHRAKLTGGPLDGQIRSLQEDGSLAGDPQEKGNPQLVIHYEQVSGKNRIKGMYLRRYRPLIDGTWEYLHLPDLVVEPIEDIANE